MKAKTECGQDYDEDDQVYFLISFFLYIYPRIIHPFILILNS